MNTFICLSVFSSIDICALIVELIPVNLFIKMSLSKTLSEYG